MYIPIAFLIELQVRVSHSLRSLAINPLPATRVCIYMPTLNFLRLPQAYIYARIEKSLYNRLFKCRYNLWLNRLLVQLFPKRVVVVLYVGFQFSTFLQPRIFTRVPKHDPKIEVRRRISYHYSPVGGHMGQL